jgi:putative lipoic acid-binding regulatory protein
MEQDQNPPKIEFPCHYPIKVLGDAREDFIDRVFEIMQATPPRLTATP